MIYVYGPEKAYCDELLKALKKKSFDIQVFTDTQALGSAIKREIPQGLFYDLRFESESPIILERTYLETPDIILLGTAERHLEMFEQYTDQLYLPYANFQQIADGFADHINDRKMLKSCGFIGRSIELIGVARMIEQVAPTDITVLVSGPSGAGKEKVAQAIHDKSAKPTDKFISLNIGSLAPGVLESELFGHEKGSFTGAVSRRIGHFEQAAGGTMFLDEIGELPADLQVKLLRVLEEKSFYRVGGQQKISTDARMIFATNKDLGEEVAIGNFRQDLYYRLNVVNITVLPLATRPKDIPPLVKEFIKKSRYGDYAGDHPVEPGAMKMIMKYHWPGNVRELKNVVESLLILSDKGVITRESFEKYLQEKSLHDGKLPVPTGRTSESAEHQLIIQAILALKDEIGSLRKYVIDNSQSTLTDSDRLPEQADNLNMESNERNLIVKTLKEVDGNRRRAARLLGIGERTLYRKLDKYGLN
ncbi:MAG: sigma-54-dependent Fis family transcriptional regulator [candidate division Zixibacteria bacterium]|nr:sigma-54-dependent Fis family transcriptional regulator [candidate division Zixibacteria bacterium]